MANMDQITLPDGSGSIDVPEWARDATLQRILAELEKQTSMLGTSSGVERIIRELLKSQDESHDISEKLLEELKKLNKTTEEAHETAQENLKHDRDEAKRQAQAEQARKQSEQVGPGLMDSSLSFEKLGKVIGGMVGSSLGFGLRATLDILWTSATTTAGAFLALTNSMLDAGMTLQKLSLTGVGVNQAFMGTETGMVNMMGRLSAVTGGFDEAANLIEQFPGELLIMGGDNFVDTMEFASAAASELGLTMHQSMEEFGAALQRRSAMLDLGTIDQKKLQAEIGETVTLQRELGALTGVSMSELSQFTSSMIMNSDTLSVSLLRFSNTVRNNLVSDVEKFGMSLRATGGEMGGEIAETFLEAATMGSIGLSDAAIGLVTVIPRMTGELNSFIKQFQAGDLDDPAAQAERITQMLGNITAAERARMFAMAQAGDADAKRMASAIIQFEQTARRQREQAADLEKQGFKPSDLQENAREMNELFVRIRGGFSNMFITFFGNDKVQAALEQLGSSILGLFGIDYDFSKPGEDVTDRINDVAKQLTDFAENKLAPAIKSLSEFLDNAVVTTKDGEVDISATLWNVAWPMIGSIVKAIGAGIVSAITGALAAQAVYSFLIKPVISSLGSGLKTVMKTAITRFLGPIFGIFRGLERSNEAAAAGGDVIEIMMSGILGFAEGVLVDFGLGTADMIAYGVGMIADWLGFEDIAEILKGMDFVKVGREFFDDLFDGGLYYWLKDTVAPWISDMLDSVAGFFGGIWTSVTDYFEGFSFGDYLETVVGIATAPFEFLKNVLGKLANLMGLESVSNLLENFDIAQVFHNIGNILWGFFKKLPGAVYSVLPDWMKHMIENTGNEEPAQVAQVESIPEEVMASPVAQAMIASGADQDMLQMYAGLVKNQDIEKLNQVRAHFLGAGTNTSLTSPVTGREGRTETAAQANAQPSIADQTADNEPPTTQEFLENSKQLLAAVQKLELSVVEATLESAKRNRRAMEEANDL